MTYYLNKIARRKTKKIMVGNVPVGSDHPISVQSMTNTLTTDIENTIKQISEIERAGADIIRVSCPDLESTNALNQIIRSINIPLVADIHFHYKRAIEAADAGASCLRINPGNIGDSSKVKEVIAAAKANKCSIRIGVNAGSLEKKLLTKYSEPCPDAMLESALNHIKILEENNFYDIKLSVKASDIFLTSEAYKLLAKKCDYPLHLGITEAGSYLPGTIKSSLGIGLLLYQGIGDTIRVSLSSNPVDEVKVGIEILKSLGLRKHGLNIISCPSCARQQFNVIETVKKLEKKFENIITPIDISIIGCVVNGPGEAKNSTIGITGGGNETHQVYINGNKSHLIKNHSIFDEVSKLIEIEISKIN